MKTFYDILKIKNNASDEEIIEAHNKLAKKFKNDEEILKNINIAKEILLNPEARKNYDKKISELEENKRQNDLISNIKNNTQKYNLKQQELLKKKEESKKVSEEETEQIEKRTIKKPQITKLKTDEKTDDENQISEKELEKQRKKEQKRQNKIKKKEEKIKQELYEEAYAKYLQSLGFTVKRKWTWKRIKRLLISILALIVICFILWQIPIVRQKLLSLYKENFVVKFFVDMISAILNAIGNGIKSLWKAGD